MINRVKIKSLLFYIVSGLFSAVFIMPILFTLSNSFMSSFEVLNRYSSSTIASNSFDNNLIHYVEINLIPGFVSLNQYIKLLFDTPVYIGMFWNSVKIMLPVVVGQVVVSLPAAYAFELSRIRIKEVVFYIYIVIMLMPLQVSLVPNFLTIEFLNLSGYWGIVLPGIFSPFGMFLIRQSLKGMPLEYYDAAKIDGASHFKIMLYIIFPMIKPSVASLTMLTFVDYWNVVDQAVVFIKDIYSEPLSVYLSRLSENNPGIIFAASCFYMMPCVLIFLYGQENLVEGIRLSGIK